MIKEWTDCYCFHQRGLQGYCLFIHQSVCSSMKQDPVIFILKQVGSWTLTNLTGKCMLLNPNLYFTGQCECCSTFIYSCVYKRFDYPQMKYWKALTITLSEFAKKNLDKTIVSYRDIWRYAFFSSKVSLYSSVSYPNSFILLIKSCFLTIRCSSLYLPLV